MKKYLIIPAMPTPNGPLHLGHIGGPYLRADILARHLRQHGNHVTMLSGTDNFENYTVRQSVKENLPPLAICQTYYPQIADDLKTMNISFDDFINPHADQWLDKYSHWCFKLINNAENANKISKIGNDYAIDLPQHADLENKGISRRLINAYRKYVSTIRHKNILTTDSDWGFKFGSDKTLLSYACIYAYYLMLGDYAGKNLDCFVAESVPRNDVTADGSAMINSLAADSDTTVIATFGVDNTMPALASVLGFSDINPNYKPIDYYLINYFYYFNGEKFSTSRRHAIWVSDIKKSNISIDILRFYLASINVNDATGNFSYDDFLLFHASLSQQLDDLITYPAKSSSQPHAKSSEFLSKIDAALRPDQFKPHVAVKAIQDWLSLGNSINKKSSEYDAWLKTFGFAVYPFMPELSEKIQHITSEKVYAAI